VPPAADCPPARQRQARGRGALGPHRVGRVRLTIGSLFSGIGDEEVRRKGWAVLTRGELLDILPQGRESVKNAVFLDFLVYLERAEAAVESFRLCRRRGGGRAAAEEYVRRTSDPLRDSFAFVWITTHDGRTAVTRALVDSGTTEGSTGRGEVVGIRFDLPPQFSGLYTPQAVAAQAACAVLQQRLKREFFVIHKWD
jgi:hypothetical protein